MSISQENATDPQGHESAASAAALSEYRQGKFALAELIGAAKDLAAERHHAPVEDRARELLARLAEDQFQLAVVGQFSRGKSTLMNAILGAAYLPTGALPMTSVVTTIRYGSRPRVTVRRRGAGRVPIQTSLDALAAFVAQASSEREELQVASADVALPAPILRLGFSFIDTPGIGSAIAANTATTRRFLPDADAVIFVTSFDAPLGETELDFLRDVQRQVERLFFVVNKLDLVSAREADEIVRFIRDRLSRGADRGEPRIFALSAEDALRARLQGDTDSLGVSGLPEFERSLVRFLTSEKSRSFLATMSRRGERLLARQRLDLEFGRVQAHQDPPDRERQVELFQLRIDRLLREEEQVAARLCDRSASELAELLSERSLGWAEELRDLARRHVDEQWPEPPSGRLAGPSLRESASRLEAAGPALFADWLTRRRAETRSLLVELAGVGLTQLYSLRDSVERIGAQIFGASVHEPGADPGWSPSTLPELAVAQMRFLMPVDASRRPLRRPHSKSDARARLLQSIDPAAVAFGESVRAALVEAAERWVEVIATRVQGDTRSIADRILDSVRDPGTDEQLAVLESLENRLAGLEAELSGRQPAAGDSSTGEHSPALPPSHPERPGPCVVCHRIADVPFRYMAHAQWELARRDEQRANHVHRGGFCAMHTWQYAEIASDVGIATAYAPLAEAAAELISPSSPRAADDGSLREALSTLMPGPDRCPACAALVQAERDAVRDVIDALPPRPSGQLPPDLCVPHLAAVLATEPEPEQAAWLANSLARTLRRLSEDMRAYALKRASLRAHLLTEEESAAPIQTIADLVGYRELVRPLRRSNEIG